MRRPIGDSAVLHAGDICYAVVARLGGGLRRTCCQVVLGLAREQGASCRRRRLARKRHGMGP